MGISRGNSVWSHALIAIGALVVAATPLRAADAWITVTSPHFTMLAQAPERQAKQYLDELEQFYHCLDAAGFGVDSAREPPLTIVLFKQDRDMAPYLPISPGKPEFLFAAGALAAAPTVDADGTVHLTSASQIGKGVGAARTPKKHPQAAAPSIVINTRRFHILGAGQSGEWNRTADVLKEGIVHWYLGESELPIPAWAAEGLAEAYSMSKAVDGSHMAMGLPKENAVEILNTPGLERMPLEQVVAKTWSAADSEPSSVRAAEAWLLINYEVFDQGGGNPERLIRYCRLLNSKQAAGAFEAAFGGTQAQVEEAMFRYVKGGRLSSQTIHVAEENTIPLCKAAPAGEAEVRLFMGSMLLINRGVAAAAADLKAAAAASPGDRRAWEALGEMEVASGNEDAAGADYQKAIDAGGADYMDDYLFAMARVGLPGGFITPTFKLAADPEPSLDLLRHAIELNPHHEIAYEGLARVLAGATSASAGDIAILESGSSLFPSDLIIAAGVAIAETKAGKRDEGRRALAQLLAGQPEAAGPVEKYVREFLATDDFNWLTDQLTRDFDGDRYKDAIAAIDRTDLKEFTPARASDILYTRKKALEYERIKEAIDTANKGHLREAAESLRAMLDEAGITPEARSRAKQAIAGVNRELALRGQPQQ